MDDVYDKKELSLIIRVYGNIIEKRKDLEVE